MTIQELYEEHIVPIDRYVLEQFAENNRYQYPFFCPAIKYSTSNREDYMEVIINVWWSTRNAPGRQYVVKSGLRGYFKDLLDVGESFRLMLNISNARLLLRLKKSSKDIFTCAPNNQRVRDALIYFVARQHSTFQPIFPNHYE
jgi:hypothetical protein